MVLRFAFAHTPLFFSIVGGLRPLAVKATLRASRNADSDATSKAAWAFRKTKAR
jgi:hypothetical protein